MGGVEPLFWLAIDSGQGHRFVAAFLAVGFPIYALSSKKEGSRLDDLFCAGEDVRPAAGSARTLARPQVSLDEGPIGPVAGAIEAQSELARAVQEERGWQLPYA